MQEPLTSQAAEPGSRTARSGPEVASSDVQEPADDELHRVESLLAARSREASILQGELARQRTLLREALDRVTATTSAELSALRRARDAAVQRAIEAELGRAALAFELDETRACLQTVPGGDAIRELRSVYARIAQVEESQAAEHARLVLAQHDLSEARERIQQLERQRVEEGEAFELSLLRARAETGQPSVAARPATGERKPDASALHGELNGLRARVLEAERAIEAACERGAASERGRQDSAQQLSEVRAKSAELAVLAQARAGQISELGQELGRQQQETRARDAQLQAALAAQLAERQARDADVQAFLQRIAALEAGANASGPRQSWVRELRDFLGSLRAPLAELETALLDPQQHGVRMEVQASEAPGEATQPGSVFDPAAVTELEDKLKTADARIAELETVLAARQVQVRDVGMTTLRGELIDTRADAARLSDDLAKERVRRRKLVFTARALQAATESGEAPGPWIEELITLLNEGASVPPFGSQPPRSQG